LVKDDTENGRTKPDKDGEARRPRTRKAGAESRPSIGNDRPEKGWILGELRESDFGRSQCDGSSWCCPWGRMVEKVDVGEESGLLEFNHSRGQGDKNCGVTSMQNLITEEKIREITQKIVKEFKPEKIILFGSYAWGEPNEDSDVDLFLVKNTRKRRVERGREVQRILWGSKIPVDVLVYTPEEIKKRLAFEDFFIEDIMQKGKILYSAS